MVEQSAAEKTALDGIRQERERLRKTTCSDSNCGQFRYSNLTTLTEAE